MCEVFFDFFASVCPPLPLARRRARWAGGSAMKLLYLVKWSRSKRGIP